jgi:hypothetical protein
MRSICGVSRFDLVFRSDRRPRMRRNMAVSPRGSRGRSRGIVKSKKVLCTPRAKSGTFESVDRHAWKRDGVWATSRRGRRPRLESGP